MSDGTIKLCYECLEERNKELEELLGEIKREPLAAMKIEQVLKGGGGKAVG